MTSAGEPELALQAGKGSLPWEAPWGETPSHVWTRTVVLRSLGFVDAVAFLILTNQVDGLLGSHGILPAARYLDRAREALGGLTPLRVPSLFLLSASDATLRAAAYLGLGLSLLVLAGYGNAIVLGVIWLLYLSFTEVGQIFWGYGWDILLLEAGFLAIFLAPALRLRFASEKPPDVVVWLLRWLTFRLMLGAGLIKLRGDVCWRELTCLVDHYQTQPNPSPLSYYFNELPLWAHEGGVLFNHLAELVAPFGLFGPRRVRHVAGGIIVAFQTLLILSGNLSFLNWLTIAIAFSAFDDSFWLGFVPRRRRGSTEERLREVSAKPVSTSRKWTLGVLAFVVAVLSISPVINMISPDQQMNASFDPLHLVNTYGAFGSIEHVRHEVVLEGTWGEPKDDAGPDRGVRWLEYEFPCKPGDPGRRPCLVTPYHYRLDWQMWFAGLMTPLQQPWILKLAYELLRGNRTVEALLAKDPFAGKPPRYVRALLYTYRFSPHHRAGWWERELVGEYFRPVSLHDPALRKFLRVRGWLPEHAAAKSRGGDDVDRDEGPG